MHIREEEIYKIKKLSCIGSSICVIIVTPNPYIGQKGPFKNPLFSNPPVSRVLTTTSRNQPKTDHQQK